jgi:hypothetical protein
MKRRKALLALASGGAGLGLLGYALRRSVPSAKGVEPTSGAKALLPLRSELGRLSEQEKQRVWQLAVATGALWGLSELSQSELFGFLDLKTQSPPSYLAEYRNALELFASACQNHPPPEAVAGILRQARGQSAAEHARRFVFRELIALHLASGGFHEFGLTRFRGFIGDGYRVSPVQPGRRR